MSPTYDSGGNEGKGVRMSKACWRGKSCVPCDARDSCVKTSVLDLLQPDFPQGAQPQHIYLLG